MSAANEPSPTQEPTPATVPPAPSGSPVRVITASLLIAANLAIFLPAFGWLIFYLWREDANSSIGILPLIISCVWIGLGWKSISNQPTRHWVPAALLLFSGCWLWLAAWAADASIMQGEALTIVLAGMVWLYGGETKLRRLAFPIAYLLLAFPLPGIAEHYLSLPLRLWSARLASVFIAAVGLPGELHGTSIVGPQFTFEVAAACSGLKTVYTFLVAGILVARLVHRNNWHFLIQIAVIPFATLLANSLRITAIAWIGYHFGLNATTGLAHESAGTVFFAVIFFGFMAAGRWLAMRTQRRLATMQKTQPAAMKSKQGDSKASSYSQWVPANKILVIHSLCLILLGVFWFRIEQNKSVLAHPTLPTISYSLAGWIGHDAPLEAQEADFWGRAYLMKRRYLRDQETVDFISSTSRPDRHNLHEPSGCYPSQGWHILSQETRWIETPKGLFPVRCLRLTRPDESTKQSQELFALFWFQQSDGTTLARGLDLLYLAVKERLLLRPEKTWTLYSLASLRKDEKDAVMWERLDEFAKKLRTETINLPSPTH